MFSYKSFSIWSIVRPIVVASGCIHMGESLSRHSDFVTDSIKILLKILHLNDVVYSLEHVGLLVDGCSKMIQGLVVFLVSGWIAAKLNPLLKAANSEHGQTFFESPMIVAHHSIPRISDSSEPVVVIVFGCVITFVILVLFRDVGSVRIFDKQLLQARTPRLRRMDIYEEIFVVDHKM